MVRNMKSFLRWDGFKIFTLYFFCLFCILNVTFVYLILSFHLKNLKRLFSTARLMKPWIRSKISPARFDALSVLYGH